MLSNLQNVTRWRNFCLHEKSVQDIHPQGFMTGFDYELSRSIMLLRPEGKRIKVVTSPTVCLVSLWRPLTWKVAK
jgi:hypothetical protein